MNNSTHRLSMDSAAVCERPDAKAAAAESTSSVSCYDHHIPDFAEAALERLYGNLFSSLPELKIYGKLTRQTSTYVVRNGDEITTIFLFEHRDRRIQVINEGMKVSADELALFARTMFSRYRSADFIDFKAIEATAYPLAFPCQRVDRGCDLVLDLPATPDDYLASLGKHLRYNIRRALARLPAEHPSFRIDFFDAAGIRESHVREIIGLNKARMANVNRVYRRDQDEVQRVIDLCRARGLVAVMSIDGRVCAGSVGFVVGNTHIGRIVGHDPGYDRYSLGTLCIFLCIRECIARGYQRFNFMSGNNEYKTLLGGVPHDLAQIVLYRSRAQLLLNPDVAARMLAAKLAGRAKQRVQLKLSTLRNMKSQGKLDARAKLLFFALDHLRTLKDHVSGFAKRR